MVPWDQLARYYVGATTPRQFKANFGVGPDVLDVVYSWVERSLDPVDMLMFLNSMKIYKSYDASFNAWKCCVRTYQDRLHHARDVLNDAVSPSKVLMISLIWYFKLTWVR